MGSKAIEIPRILMNTKTAQLQDGKALAEKIQTKLKQRIQALQPQLGRPQV